METKTKSRSFRKKKEFDRAATASVRWFAAFMLLFYSYWWVMTNFVIRDFYDYQYALKYDYLRARMNEHPGRPLWLVMGGSHVEDGLRLSLVQDRLGAANSPLVFNFSLSGSDLFRQFICLQRVITSGIKPQRVGIEVVGLFLNQVSGFVSNPNLNVRARREELDEYAAYSTDPGPMLGSWRQSRYNPFYKYGIKTPHQTRTMRLVPFSSLWHAEEKPYDIWGWTLVPDPPIPADLYRIRFEQAKTMFQGDIAHFKVARNNDRILRQILDLCKKDGIDVFLFRSPEAGDFQALYPAGMNAAIDTYLAAIEKEYDVRMIDGHSWDLDPADYFDGHHVNSAGAAKFTCRFVDEMFRTAKPSPAN